MTCSRGSGDGFVRPSPPTHPWRGCRPVIKYHRNDCKPQTGINDARVWRIFTTGRLPEEGVTFWQIFCHWAWPVCTAKDFIQVARVCKIVATTKGVFRQRMGYPAKIISWTCSMTFNDIEITVFIYILAGHGGVRCCIFILHYWIIIHILCTWIHSI